MKNRRSSGWGCTTSPGAVDSLQDVLCSTFGLLDLYTLMGCESVCKAWNSILRLHMPQGTYCEHLRLESQECKYGSHLVNAVADEAPLRSICDQSFSAFFYWLSLRAASITRLTVGLSAGYWLLPKVLAAIYAENSVSNATPLLELHSGVQPVLAAPVCCSLLASNLMTWLCEVQPGHVDDWQNVTQLTALTRLRLTDEQNALTSMTELQHLTKLRHLIINQYDTLLYTMVPFVNLLDLRLNFGSGSSCNLKSCTQLRSLDLEFDNSLAGLQRLILPSGDNVQLQTLHVYGESESGQASFVLRNLELALQLSSFDLINVYPWGWSEVKGWPCSLPKLRYLNVRGVLAKMPSHGFFQYHHLRYLCWSSLQAQPPDCFSKLTQLQTLELTEAHLMTIPAQIFSLSQLSKLCFSSEHTLNTTNEVLQFATWPSLEWLHINASEGFSLDAQLILCELSRRTYKVNPEHTVLYSLRCSR